MVAISTAFGLYVSPNVVYPIEEKNVKLDKNFNLSACLYSVCKCDEFLKEIFNHQAQAKKIHSCTSVGGSSSVLCHEEAHGKKFVRQFSEKWKKET